MWGRKRAERARDEVDKSRVERERIEALSLVDSLTEDQRVALAADSGTPPSVLAVLAEDEAIDVRSAVASNPAADGDTLALLVESLPPPLSTEPGPDVAPDWLEYKRSRLELDRSSAERRHSKLRHAVARNPSAPEALLRTLNARNRHLAQDGSQLDIVRNPSAPTPLLDEIIERASKDFQSTDSAYQQLEWRYLHDVLGHAAKHPNTSPKSLNFLANLGWVAQVAGNPGAPADLLIGMAKAWGSEPARSHDHAMAQYDVCRALARNPSLPADAAVILSSHSHPTVVKDVREHHGDKLG